MPLKERLVLRVSQRKLQTSPQSRLADLDGKEVLQVA
jgi:hypothetical protein